MAEQFVRPLEGKTNPQAEEVPARALAARNRLECVDMASFASEPEIVASEAVDLIFQYNFLLCRRERG